MVQYASNNSYQSVHKDSPLHADVLRTTSKLSRLKMSKNPTDTFKAALQSAHPTNTMSSTRVQCLQNGSLYSIDLPGHRNPHETERLQEYMQNTAFGTTNLLKSMSKGSINSLPNYYYCWTEEIVGGVFDGLSRGEAQFLREQGWTEDRQWYDPELSEEEMGFLYGLGILGAEFTIPSVQTAAQSVVGPPSHSAPQITSGESASVALLCMQGLPVPDDTPHWTKIALKEYEEAQQAAKREAEAKAKAKVKEKAKAEEEKAKKEAEEREKKGLCAVGDGRPTTGRTAGVRNCSTSTATSSSSTAHSTQVCCTPSTSASSSRNSSLARLVDASTPENEDTSALSTNPRPTCPFVPWTATFKHEQAHGLICPYKCEYDPSVRAYLFPNRLLQTSPPASPPASPSLAIGRLHGLRHESVREEVPVVDWEREGRRWRFSRGGQRGDPAVDTCEW